MCNGVNHSGLATDTEKLIHSAGFNRRRLIWPEVDITGIRHRSNCSVARISKRHRLFRKDCAACRERLFSLSNSPRQ